MNEDTDFQDTAQKEEKYRRSIFTISEKQEILILHNLPQIEHIYYKIDSVKKLTISRFWISDEHPPRTSKEILPFRSEFKFVKLVKGKSDQQYNRPQVVISGNA